MRSSNMLIRCLVCNYWGKADMDADDDVIQVAEQSKAEPEAETLLSAEIHESSDPVGKGLPIAGELGNDRVTVTSAEDETVTAPASDATVLALPQAESVKRVRDLLKQGGLLLTEIMRNKKKIIRRLELDEKAGVVTWSIDRVMGVFGNPFEQVKLQNARIMCDGKMVKIGRARRQDFHTFEACDAEEAAAVCDCLVDAAKKLSTPEIA